MARQALEEIEANILALSAEQFGIRSAKISLNTRPVQDLGIDSLDLIEWMMAVEEAFDVSLPDAKEVGDPAYKEVFTRRYLTFKDMAELVHLRSGSGHTEQTGFGKATHQYHEKAAFSQLGGALESQPSELYRSLGKSDLGVEQFRRMTDGMVCMLLKGGSVEIGSKCADAHPDEKPLHTVDIEPFLIDRETVSTTAFCRFLNSIGAIDDEVLCKWFLIRPGERRFDHQLIESNSAGWSPKSGTEEWPMILVTWYGAVAYSLWANGHDWHAENSTFLPSEAQWEYAARGPTSKRWPWGDDDLESDAINAGKHQRHAAYKDVADLPLEPVNAKLGVSPFGGLQMAGNVWQWCADWFDPSAYARGGAPSCTGIRSERGGSWVSPTDLSRSSYRRGRIPDAKGRCLGFRCVGPYT
ncbi:SUMF1/EgtB/PvdO family nonheme iron enzyme [Sulfitobacter albidus]|uniref:SUMF1/EgtB/PvdO family nonheme iron enzyme n=1 Tax=Sulfitobacter albidus TaxID=2829501 RepID=A0A975JFK8_9RHOB|nr:SUMF1/EgtB/PvdO family nonheme iron enzyme [Sulfitobacter albidus]QUJ77350.1 SUMF1/EgtB/PvdO family nonheme iron enzyme [Sulfitobacter albidus]